MSTELKIIGGIALTCIVIIIGAIFFLGQPSTNLSEATLNSQALIKGDSPQIGQGQKVTIVEFADFQCPACQAVSPYLESIVKKYPQDVKLVFRHFPLTQHQNAIPAAKAAEAAGMQGKFWEMYVALYAHQNEWAESSDPESMFEKLASENGVNVTQFKEDIKDPKVQDKITRDVEEGTNLGVNATPTIFINGKKFEGTFTDLESAVKSEIK